MTVRIGSIFSCGFQVFILPSILHVVYKLAFLALKSLYLARLVFGKTRRPPRSCTRLCAKLLLHPSKHAGYLALSKRHWLSRRTPVWPTRRAHGSVSWFSLCISLVQTLTPCRVFSEQETQSVLCLLRNRCTVDTSRSTFKIFPLILLLCRQKRRH